MKALTVNRMAAARLRANKKGYISLIVGIFLSVFLVTTLVLCIQGVILAQMEQNNKRLGFEDAFLLDTPELSDRDLAEMGYFDTIGHVYVTAGIKDTDIYLGWYDETGSTLLSRQVLEGRMPEKAGEIAMERSAMLAIREEGQWQLGEEVTLKVIPVDGVEEERTFTLVGFLAEQSSLLTNLNSSSRAFVTGFPAILVSSSEPDFLSGRVVLHRLMTLTVPITEELFKTFYNRIEDHALGRFLVKTIEGKLIDSFYSDYVFRLNSEAFMIAMMAGLLILSLLLSCCVGIAGSMEGILSKRSEEIGILRALGATKRQIRRMFGRESWLLALTAAPLSIALSCLFVWGLELWMPENMVFRFNPLLIVPVVVLSAAVILISGSIPLRRASRQMPMSVIRDTELLRKSKHIRSRKQFRVPELISQRLVRLYPKRLLGAVILSALMCFCAALLAIVLYGGVRTFTPSQAAYAIMMQGNGSARGYVSYLPGQPLSDQSLNQLRGLPHVRKVNVNRQLRVCLLLEGKTSYFNAGHYHNDALMTLEEYTEYSRSLGDTADLETLRQRYAGELASYDAARNALGTSQELVMTELQTVTPEQLEQLEASLGSGGIHLDAINAGKEVLVVAPQIWWLPEPGTQGYRLTDDPSEAEMEKAAMTVVNDWAFAGQELPIVQLYTDDAQAGTTEDTKSLYEGCTRRDAVVTIGAVLDSRSDFLGGMWGAVLTTEEGLRNMGLFRNGWDVITIYLDGIVDEETEEALTQSITAIARRAEGSRVYNYMESARENARTQLQLMLLMGAITIVFFAVVAGMIVSTVTRQLQADGKRIGMLRAVGADEKTILRCYTGQIFLSLGLGMVLSILVMAVLFTSSIMNVPARYYPSGIATILVFSLSCLGLCLLLLRRRVRQITGQSIIDNIREL
ncbi:MAG: FtsX-like permease family protein [Faecousia sp.]